jgi:NADPH:quinone reductase-like Zn-dependent oxidoreductase
MTEVWRGPGKSRSLWFVGIGKTEIRSEPLDVLAPGFLRVRALYGAISRGTESLIFNGQVPESEFGRMRAPFMAGDFPFPVKYGYAAVGRVEGGAEEMIGRTVFALHPHQTVFDIPFEAARPLPGSVPPRRGVLAANMETALNAVWDASPHSGDRVAVVGAGVVGTLVGFLCTKLNGAHVTLVDIDPARAEIAKTLGLAFALPGDSPKDCALVVHASASAAGLETALNAAGDEATVLEMSWFGSAPVAVPLGGAFHSRRLKLISSQVGKVAPSHRAQWSYAQRLAAAIDLLDDPRLDALLAPAVSFDDLNAVLPKLFAPGSGALCQVIDYS